VGKEVKTTVAAVSLKQDAGWGGFVKKGRKLKKKLRGS